MGRIEKNKYQQDKFFKDNYRKNHERGTVTGYAKNFYNFFKKRWQHTYNNNGGLTIPGYNYCGPGNRMEGEPINNLDAACMRHDQTPGYSYTEYEKSDDDLIREANDHFWEDPFSSSIIQGVFGAKRMVARKRRYSQSRGSSKRRRVSRRRPMKYRKNRKYNKKRSFKRKFKRRYRRFNRRYRRKSNLNTRILKLLNPPQTWRYGFVTEYNAPVNTHIMMNPLCYYQGLTYTATDIHNLFTRPGMEKIITDAFADTADYDKQFWFLNRAVTLKMKVNCVSKVFGIVYYCVAKDLNTKGPIQDVIADLQNSSTYKNVSGGEALATNAALNITTPGTKDPIPATAFIDPVSTDSGTYALGPEIVKINPMVNLTEAEIFKKRWKVYKCQKLEWDNQKVHYLKLSSRKPHLYDKNKYLLGGQISAGGTTSTGGTTCDYKRGDRAIFIRFYTDALPSAGTAGKVGYPKFSIAMEVKNYARYVRRVVTQKEHSIYWDQTNISNDPVVVEITESAVSGA